MKRIIVLFIMISVFLMSMSFSVMAADKKVNVVIPDYEIIIDDSSVYYYDSVYPFLNYKGITYFPMTYEYSRALNLTTGWLDGTALLVACNPSYDKLPVYETTNNKKYNTAVVPTGYRIYVNGKKVDNKNAQFPLLNFRDVTYFPVTWEYAVENFGWKINFEDNIFRINTENNTVDRWTLVEKRDDDAVLDFYYAKEIPQENGEIKYDYRQEFYSLNYKTGELTLLPDYVEKEYIPKNTGIEITVDNGYAYCDGKKLDDIFIASAASDYVKPDDVEKTEYFIFAHETTMSEILTVAEVRIKTFNHKKDGSSYGNDITYEYIRQNGEYIFLGRYTTVKNVYSLGDDLYFNTVTFGQTLSRHYLNNNRMWKLSKDGTLTEIKYADYNSMEIIGKVKEKLYIKCLWSPENHIDDAPYSVSLVNDGYYTFDGEGIRLVSPYIYSDFDIVSENGDIFAVNNILDKIIKCEINSEYY